MATRLGQGAIRRAIATLAVVTVTWLAFGVPAKADPAAVDHVGTSANTAYAYWRFQSGTKQIDASVIVFDGANIYTTTWFPSSPGSKVTHTSSGIFFIDVSDLDANGDITGGVAIVGFPDASLAGTVDPALRAASLLGSDVPVWIIPYGPDGSVAGPPTYGTVDVDMTWDGQGRIVHDPAFIIHGHITGYLMNQTFAGPTRAATAGGVVAGIALPAPNSAILARQVYVRVLVVP